MPSITGPTQDAIIAADPIEADFKLELALLEAEAIGWQSLDTGCYLHTGTDATEVLIVGTASASMSGINVLWVY